MSSFNTMAKACLRLSIPGLMRVLSIGIALVLASGGCMASSKDTINHISFSHDSKKVLFDRCRNDRCQIEVYDLESGELAAYESPPDERWSMARYSYDGTKIVFSIIPISGKYLTLKDMQIAVMDPDGKNIRIITTGPGAKIYPTFSHSGTKVLYSRAGYIRKSGKTPAAQFDAWEVDLTTGKEKRLTFFKFFNLTDLTYFLDDKQFLCWGFAPETLPGIPENNKEEFARRVKAWTYGANNIYALREGMTKEEPPYVIAGDEHGNISQNPLLSRDGKVLLFESRGAFYQYSPDGKHRRVTGGGSIDSAAISPDGEYLGYIAGNVGMHLNKIANSNHEVSVFVPMLVREGLDYKSNPKFLLLPEVPSLLIKR